MLTLLANTIGFVATGEPLNGNRGLIVDKYDIA